jgi:phosphotransferase system  glucose/maltose/N-acetylglucosamine-specific IIC component
MPENEPSEQQSGEQQLDSGFKGCLPLLVPFVTVIVLIILVLLGFWLWGKISP